MITHIVCFKLKDRSAESVEKTRQVLLGLRGKVPQLRRLEVGADVVRSERSYDLALTATFDSM
jgi:Stress responsive A/B Barrel Domain